MSLVGGIKIEIGNKRIQKEKDKSCKELGSNNSKKQYAPIQLKEQVTPGETKVKDEINIKKKN